MKAIIIGATSGIGHELAKLLPAKGYEVGITGRRTNILEQMQREMPGKLFPMQMDVAKYDDARQKLHDLIDQMQGLDLIVVNAGVGDLGTDWSKENGIISTNVHGFVAIANAAYHYFAQNGGGHLVGISSVAAERGGGQAPAYHASKAFVSTYLQGLRYRSAKKGLNITVTDIRPGFVKSPMTDKNDFHMPWLASTEKAAEQIYAAIERKKKKAYITKRWVVPAKLFRFLPDAIIARIT